MKHTYFLSCLAVTLSTMTFAQIGINSPTPEATFDIVAKNSQGKSTAPDGLLIPRIDRERAQNMNGAAISTLVYVNSVATGTQTGKAVNIDNVGYYYFDGISWIKLGVGNVVDTDNNLYNTSGTLEANRTVAQADKTLAFTSTATTGTNQFSVDGATFSVDAVNNRVGLGTTTPKNILDLGPANGKKLALWNSAAGDDFYGLGNAANVLQLFAGATATGDALMTLNKSGKVGIGTTAPNSRLDLGPITDPKKLAVFNNAQGTDFYGLGAEAGNLQLRAGTSAANEAPAMVVRNNGNVGVATNLPQTKFHVVGSRRFENATPGTVVRGSVLTATDSNGTAEWKSPTVETVVGGIDAAATGIDIPFASNGNYMYTGRYISLPPGKWAITITQLAQTYGTLDNDDWVFVRSTFGEGSPAIGAVVTRSPDVTGGPSFMSFRVQGPASGSLQQFDVAQGTVFINNTSGATKTYRYIAGNTVAGGNPNPATTVRGFGANWSESSIFATAIN